MRAFVTSIGEPTTDLCMWSLERLGFEVKLVKADDTLAEKLHTIYNLTDESFLRVDADVIVNRNVLVCEKIEAEYPDKWWVQFKTFDWWKQDIGNGGVQYVNKKALPALRANIDHHLKAERPESQMFRLDEFHNPRRCFTVPIVAGLNGWGQTDVERVKATKERRGQMDDYDFELAEKLC